ncbi:LptF/LptG family permease [Coraliomargarita akajimensis]|uniref:Permease YjgP/YjgQ family protein n=1 Tax=Coraliomargarita akajimensis (strain DSM 45221 / IAM 15411 / JCM 23193 / KCTC 12865 / 04OKA010-24) TaxID=583355 RepID=D5END1_CORAD|nr:LptF/LptG family permease [Coraliomargarita akajimensis]ADE55407.1 permease YjgP/YjgQ family protein [Coraliomargarita akajimensis DSM 45221]
MLNLLHRHVFKEIAVAILLAMGLFIFVLLTGNAIRDVAALVAAGKLDAMTFIKLMGLLIPYVAAYALPLGILTGTLMALGRLSSQREITAMKSAGLSLYQIASPVFFIAFIAMVLSLVVNLDFAPRAKSAFKEMLASTISENPVKFIEEKKFITGFPGYVIYMGDHDGGLMKDFWVWELDDRKQVTRFVRAESGELDYDREANELVLRVYNATAELRDDDAPETLLGEDLQTIFFQETEFALPLERLFGQQKTRHVKIKNMNFAQLMEVREAALQAEAQSEEPGISKQRMQAQVQIQKNCAMAFSTFSLALFGVPLAIQVGRKESYANLAIALIIAMTYYFLMIVVSWMEDRIELRPDLLIWLPNILFQGIGLYLIRRAGRN